MPVTLRQFIDWFSHTHPEEFAEDEKAAADPSKGDGPVGIKARYEKYRKSIISKQVGSPLSCHVCLGVLHVVLQMQLMFQYHIKYPWFNEKYNPAEPFANLRLRVRREGWGGRVDNFVDLLMEGKYDYVTETQEAAGTAQKSETNGVKPNNGDAKHANNPSPTEGQDADMANGEDERAAEEAENERDGNEDTESTVKGDSATAIGDAEKGKDDATVPKTTTTSGRENKQTRFEEEEVTAEPEGNQVLIRTIPPDIGRVKLERVSRIAVLHRRFTVR